MCTKIKIESLNEEPNRFKIGSLQFENHVDCSNSCDDKYTINDMAKKKKIK